MVGCLTHLSVMMQPVLHFLSPLCHLMECTSHQQQVCASHKSARMRTCSSAYLTKSAAGVNLNIVTFCMPTRVYRKDACSAGLGGYSLQGRAWRFLIPPHLQRRATINFLEHISAKVGLQVDLEEGTLPRLSCVLTMTDSTTARRWLHRPTSVRRKRPTSRFD